MLKEKEKTARTAMVALDAIVIYLVFAISFALKPFFYILYELDFLPSAQIVSEKIPVSINDYILALFLIIPLWCAMLSLNGMYSSLRTKTFIEISWRVIRAALMTMLVFGAFVFLLKLKFISRVFFGIFMSLSLVAIIVEKVVIFSVMHYVRRQGYNYRVLLMVGTGQRAADFIERVKRHSEWGFRILGVVEDEKGHKGRKVQDVEIIGDLLDLPKILEDNAVDEIIFIVPRSRLNEIENSLYVCETRGIQATIAVDLFDLKIAKSRQTEIDDIPLITFETTPTQEGALFLKRMADVVISGLGIVLLSPLFLLAALLIKATSKGPVMFLQKRVGKNGRKFILYKFRTMYKDADERQAEIASLNIMKGPVFKVKNDPRITPIGRILRKFSIDEFPQLFNVFIGHMSLVGPRPALVKEVAQYEPWQRRRLSMRPGLTCLWQVGGRSRVDFNEWMRLDLEYIDNWSLWLEFKILLRTIPTVLLGIGAY